MPTGREESGVRFWRRRAQRVQLGRVGQHQRPLSGHPMSIDCILPVSDDVILTGSMDGFIRYGFLVAFINGFVLNGDYLHCI